MVLILHFHNVNVIAIISSCVVLFLSKSSIRSDLLISLEFLGLPILCELVKICACPSYHNGHLGHKVIRVTKIKNYSYLLKGKLKGTDVEIILISITSIKEFTLKHLHLYELSSWVI